MLPALPRPSIPAPLLAQCRHFLRTYTPSPAPVLRETDRCAPFMLKQLIAEAVLNRMFATAIQDGEFDDFDGRTVRLEINGGGPGITLGFWQGRLRAVEGEGEAVIRGSWSAFAQLADRKLDPDQLFFQRRLTIEGNTELGLGIKNLLDSLDWEFPKPSVPGVALRIAQP